MLIVNFSRVLFTSWSSSLSSSTPRPCCSNATVQRHTHTPAAAWLASAMQLWRASMHKRSHNSNLFATQHSTSRYYALTGKRIIIMVAVPRRKRFLHFNLHLNDFVIPAPTFQDTIKWRVNASRILISRFIPLRQLIKDANCERNESAQLVRVRDRLNNLYWCALLHYT
jgi:hypothetical protein